MVEATLILLTYFAQLQIFIQETSPLALTIDIKIMYYTEYSIVSNSHVLVLIC